MDLGQLAGKLQLRKRDRYFESAGGGEASGPDVGQWILSRRHYHYATFDLPEVTGAKQRNVVRMRALQASPFLQTGYLAHHDGRRAAAFIWDNGRLQDAIAGSGFDLTGIEVLPETAIQAQAPDGARLISCLDGFEGQVWKDNWLAASRWWPEPPSVEDWVRFQRGAGVALDGLTSSVAAPEGCEFLEKSWVKSISVFEIDLSRWPVKRMALAAAAIVAAIFAYGAGSLANYQSELNSLSAGIDALHGESSGTIEARAAALENRATIESLIKLNPYPSQLALMAEVATIIGRRKMRVTKWRFQDGDMALTLEAGGGLDATFFVGAFERSDRFRDVTAKSSPNSKSLALELKVNSYAG